MEGVNPLMIAADYWGEGHFTAYPGDKTTVALQIPFENGRLPDHTVGEETICPIGKASMTGAVNGMGQALLGL